MTRWIQIKKENVRRAALVDEANVRLLKGCRSICELAQIAIDSGKWLGELAQSKDGDVMQIFAEGCGGPLRNPARVDRSKDAFIRVISLR